MKQLLQYPLCLIIVLLASACQPIPNPSLPPADPLIIGGHTIDRLSALSEFGRGDVQQITWSADGNRIFVATTAGVWIHDLREVSAPPLHVTPRTRTTVYGVAVHPSGDVIALALGNGGLEVITLSRLGLAVQIANAHSGRSLAVTFSADGRFIYSSGQDGRVRRWQTATGGGGETLYSHLDWVTSLVADPRQSDVVLMIGRDHQAILLDSRQTDPIAQAAGVFGTASGAALNGGQVRLASANINHELVESRFPPLTEQTYTTPYDGFINLITVSTDGTKVATAGADGEIYVWSNDWSSPPFHIPHVDRQVKAIRFNPAGTQLAVGWGDGSVRVYRLGQASGRFAVAAWFTDYSSEISRIDLTLDNSVMATADGKGYVRLWDIASGAPHTFAILRHSVRGVTALDLSDDGSAVAVGDFDGYLRVWQTQNGAQLISLKAHANAIYGVAIDRADNTIVTTASPDTYVRVWNIRSGTQVGSNQPTGRGFNAFSSNPDGTLIAIGGEDNNVTLWNLLDQTVVNTFSGHRGRLNATAFSPDGRILASGGNDRLVYLWNLTSGDILGTLAIHTGPIQAIAFSPDSRTVVLASSDDSLSFWDTQTYRLLRQIPLDSPVSSLQFSADGRILYTGDESGRVILWGLP
jgi:WD40 repeat protein